MNSQLFNRTHKLCIRNQGFHRKNEEFSNFSYLVKCNDNSFGHSLQAFSRLVCEMELHLSWKEHLLTQLKNYRCFRWKFFCWLLELLQKIKDNQCNSVKLCEHCFLIIQSSMNHHQLKCRKIKLRLKTSTSTLVHNLEPEIKWSIRVLHQMLQLLHLEAMFAWLSTLGGAHSALGDYFNKNAEVAWELSVKQLYIAIRIGNPVLAAHCKLFMAISLMQRGYLNAALKTIRVVSKGIRNDKRFQDRRLMNCCKAAKVRLKYIQQEKETTPEPRYLY